jgi:hypothetical protein
MCCDVCPVEPVENFASLFLLVLSSQAMFSFLTFGGLFPDEGRRQADVSVASAFFEDLGRHAQKAVLLAFLTLVASPLYAKVLQVLNLLKSPFA